IKAAFWRWTATMQNIVARYCQVRAWVRPTGAAGIVAAAKGQLTANLAGLARREAGIQGNRPGDHRLVNESTSRCGRGACLAAPRPRPGRPGLCSPPDRILLK